MLSILRRLRRNLLVQGRFRSYLLYAAGEVLLVVLGILIALAIDNQNEARSKREKEQAYLIGLQEEFRTSKLKLAELMHVNRRNFEGAGAIVAFLGQETPPDEERFSELLFQTFAFDVSFVPNNSLLNEMINTGSLKDISNPALRKSLTGWVSTLEDVARQEEDQEAQREKVLDMFRSGAYSIRTILDMTNVSQREIGLPKKEPHHSNLSILQSMEFENNLLLFILASQATESAHYQPLMEQLDAILVLIDTEIAD